jgi:signal transduction histidine kinase
MAPNSLAFRLFVIAIVATLAVLVLAGFFLSELYRSNARVAFEREIDLYARNLIGLVEQRTDGSLAGEPDLGDARFGAFLSGWYWQVGILRDGGLSQRLMSRSLAGEQLALPSIAEAPFDANFRRAATIADPMGKSLLAVQRLVTFESNDTVAFTVTGALADLDGEVAAFRRQLAGFLALLGLVLVSATLVVVQVGLRPLRRLQEQIHAIRAGKMARLDGRFPAEIEPLARELNELIKSNEAIIERARTHVGNLAHALKTPLSVISNEVSAASASPKLREQIELMRSQITHHLDRARVAARANVVGAVTPVAETIAALERAMQRIYSDKALRFTFECPPDAQFAGEEQDFQEMVGNLMDNACKWAVSKVEVRVAHDSAGEGTADLIRVMVDDDGPGLTDAQRASVMARGSRLDETKPGSGLGLSIVSELAGLYGGSLALHRSALGGLRAELSLPAA